MDVDALEGLCFKPVVIVQVTLDKSPASWNPKFLVTQK